ncbi:MAG: C-terminal binding protein [Desulfobacterales bacterium]|nr:C-terminal binding protein [Desulfobacterales bacterium]
MTQYNIVYADKSFPDIDEVYTILEPLGVNLIDGQCHNVEELIALSENAHIIISELIPVGVTVFKACPKLKLVVSNNIGFDIIDVPAATQYGIRVCNNPNYCLQEVAEHTIALILCLARKIVHAHNLAYAGHYNYNDLKPLFRLSGSTVGFIGFGKIARCVAKKLKGLDVNMLFYDPYIIDPILSGAIKSTFEEVLQASNYISLHLPLTDETYHLMDKNAFSLMKSSACVINVARGGVLDSQALISALENGEIRGAALDVMENEKSWNKDNPVLQNDNIIITPHSAWYSEDAMNQNKVDLANEIKRFIKAEKLTALVNPEVSAVIPAH